MTAPSRDRLLLLRPTLFVAVAAAHAAAFGYASWSGQPALDAPRLSIEVTLASPPPAVEAAAPAEEPIVQAPPTETPAEAPPEPAPPEPLPPEPLPPEPPPPEPPPPEPAPPEPPPPELTPEPPTPEPPPAETPPEPAPEPEPEPEPPALVTATPPPRPDDIAPFVAPPPKPVVRERPAVRKPVEKPAAKPAAKPKPRVARPAPPPVRAAPRTAGSESRARASVASTTQYGSVISALIRARTVFPQSARSTAGGVVTVRFVIGPSGRAVSAAVVGSSGDPALDRAALAAVQGVSAPPPPGGRYSATAPIRFRLQ